MLKYNSKDILKSLRKIGLKKGDLIHINPEIYRLGNYISEKNSNVYEEFYKSVRELIGNTGTICCNSFTFDTLRHGKKFIYESNECTSGGFSKFLLGKKKVIRSFHPVYSVLAIGPHAKEICTNNSFHNFGYNSPYEKFMRLNGKVLNLGMEPWHNQYNHVAEHMIGVPYYYNKLTNVKYFKGGKKKKIKFSTFVRYLNFNCVWDFKYIKNELAKKKFIRKAKLGGGFIYSVNAQKYLKICLNLLTKDQFGLIKRNYFFNKKNN